MKRIVAALTSVLFSFFIAQAALATDHVPYGACLIAKCSKGFSLDAKNCRCVSDSKPNPICRAIIRCKPGSDLDPETCRCIKDNLFEKADSSKPTKPELFPKFDPNKPASGDPTPSMPKEKKLPEPKIPCLTPITALLKMPV